MRVEEAQTGEAEEVERRHARRALVAVKLVHTAVWAILAGFILAVPVLAWAGALRWAEILSAVVWVEVAVILVNRWRCPLTDVAARYTPDRADNFDIYLPIWLARHNKTVFGALFAAGEAVWLWCAWRGWR